METKKFQEPNEQEIAEYAYHLWESEGCIAGRDLDYWLQAKAHLTKTQQHEAGLLKTPDSAKAETKSLQKSSTPTAVVTNSKLKKKRQPRPVQEPAYA